jgi:hypothetical protein
MTPGPGNLPPRGRQPGPAGEPPPVGMLAANATRVAIFRSGVRSATAAARTALAYRTSSAIRPGGIVRIRTSQSGPR